MNAKFIFWRNLEFLTNDHNYGKLSFSERDTLKLIQTRNTAKPVPFAEDSKYLKEMIVAVNQRNADQKRMIDGIYRR